MTQRVRAFKLESVAEGGGSEDASGGLAEVDIGQDYLDAAGVTLQRPGTNTHTADALCRVERLASQDMQFCDPNAGTVQLQALLTSLGGLPGSHNALRDPIHFLADGGPGDGFASGAVKVTTYAANSPLVASETWYASAAKTLPIYSVTYAYTANSSLPSAITRQIYSATGAVVRTLVDTPAYQSGTPVEVSSTRTWS